MSEPCAGASVPSRRAPHQTSSRLRFAILTIPYLWLVAAIPFVGYRDNRILGIPVLEVWMLAGVVVCSACLAAATYRRRDPVADYVRARLAEEDHQ